MTFSIQGYSERFPSLFEGNELITIEQQLRSDSIDAFEGDAPAGSFNDLGFSSMMNYWMASMEVSDPTDGQSVFDQVRGWSNHHAFASTPLDCALAPEDYQSLCSFNLAFGSWNGSTYDLESEHENWAGFLAELPPRG